VEEFADVTGTLEGATSGTFWRFKALYPGLIGPGAARLPTQQ
jgi:hypothetical protein